MRIIIPSFCLLFALQIQASFLSRILSKLRAPGYVGYDDLRRAIDEGRLDIAVKLVKLDETLSENGLSYVIGKDDPDFIANFVNQTNQVNVRTLKNLWVVSPIETVEKVLGKVDFPQQALVDLGSSYEVGNYPETFLVLLNKIVTPGDQEKVVEKGIERLVRWSDETSPLLNALKGKTFRSERLEYLAIQKVFMEGAKKGSVNFLPKSICNHAAITPELYADALTVTARWGSDNDVRQSLLASADQYDLQVGKEKTGYADLDAEFRDDIEKVLKTAKPGGTRTRTYDIQTVEKAEEIFEELRHDGITTEIADLISAYVTVYVPTPRRIAQIAAKKAASDVTNTSTKIEGSGDIGSERVGEY